MSKKWLWLTIGVVAIAAVILIPVIPRPKDPQGLRSRPTHPSKMPSWCQLNLMQLGLAMQIYAADYDNILPPASSWQEALITFEQANMTDALYSVHERAARERAYLEIFVCPDTNKPYVFNNALGGRDINEIASPEEVPLFWDAPADDGSPLHRGRLTRDGHRKRGFNVVFLEGRCYVLPEDEFRQLWDVTGSSVWPRAE